MTPEDGRTEPALTGDEGTLLTGFLRFQRQTLAWQCAGLTPQQQRQVATAVKNAREMALLPFTSR